MLHVLSGQAEYADEIREAAFSGGTIQWIVPKKAITGDAAVMFFPHLNAFVAYGEVLNKPTPTTFGRASRYAAEVGRFTLFPAPVPLDDIAKRYPQWGWPRAATKSLNTPPPRVQTGLLDALQRLARNGANAARGSNQR